MGEKQTGTLSVPLSGAELALLLILVILGLAFRSWRLSSAGLNHYDEGVYVFSGLGLSDPAQPYRLYPGQTQFSPPVFLELLRLGYAAFGGPSDTSAILINVILGTLTIAFVWWVGRSWFGVPAGIAAAVLLSFSDFHIALSRMALTDVPFAFFFLIALWMIGITFQRRSFRLAVIAGLAVGIAWNTKYHGALALLISGGALLPFAWFRRLHGLPWKRYFILWGVIAVVAAVCFVPWTLFIQSQPGGLVGLLKYYQMFASHGWRSTLFAQVREQMFFEGVLSRTSVSFAFLCALLAAGGRSQLTPRFVLILVLVALAGLSIGGSGTIALLTLFAIPALLRKPLSYPSWLVLGWLTVFFILTPLYRPYARLALPFSIATYLVAGFWISTMVKEAKAQMGAIAWRPILALTAAAIVTAVAVLMPNENDPWRPSVSVREAALAMETIVPPGSRVIVIGEPELAFYLHIANRPAFEKTEDPAAWTKLKTPVYFVAGVYAHRVPTITAAMKKLGNQLSPLGTFSMIPNDIRLLDDSNPSDARLYRSHPDGTFDLTLYRLSPKSAAQ